MNSWWAASNVLSLQKEETELHSFSKLEYGWRNSRSLVAWLRLSLFTFVFHLCPSLSLSFYHQRPFAQLYFICSRTHCTNKDCGLWSFFWKRDVLVLCSYYYKVRKTHCCYRYSLTTHFHPTAPKPHRNPHVKPFFLVTLFSYALMKSSFRDWGYSQTYSRCVFLWYQQEGTRFQSALQLGPFCARFVSFSLRPHGFPVSALTSSRYAY